MVVEKNETRRDNMYTFSTFFQKKRLNLTK